MTQPFLIIGGGIGGLTAALALQRQGKTVAIYEQAGAIGDVGAGISLGVTASRGLYSLGLREAIRAASDVPQASAALHYQTGEELGGGFADRPFRIEDIDYVNQIHRADLFEILKAAVLAHDPTALHLGHAFAGLEQDADGVTAAFTNGARVRGEALIGCDGIRSPVRAQIFGDESPLFTGCVVYRFLVPIEAAQPYMSAAGSKSYVAPERSLLRYTIRHGSVVNCVAFIRTPEPTGEGWSTTVPTEELLSLFPDWHPDVIGLARAAPLQGTAKWALYDRDPLDVWVEGRVALLGDAAHPMLPFLGLGAAMAVEDAVVLGRAFANADTRAALQTYQAARSQRAGDMLLDSRLQGQIFKDGPGGAKRPRISHAERMNYDPSTVAI